jgi:hypothetical protein
MVDVFPSTSFSTLLLSFKFFTSQIFLNTEYTSSIFSFLLSICPIFSLCSISSFSINSGIIVSDICVNRLSSSLFQTLSLTKYSIDVINSENEKKKKIVLIERSIKSSSPSSTTSVLSDLSIKDLEEEFFVPQNNEEKKLLDISQGVFDGF